MTLSNMPNLRVEKPLYRLGEFYEEFLHDRLGELTDMRVGLSTRDTDKVRRLAHKWKGFSAPYGFNYLETLSASLEKSAKESNIRKSYELIEKISEYLDLKKKALEKSR